MNNHELKKQKDTIEQNTIKLKERRQFFKLLTNFYL